MDNFDVNGSNFVLYNDDCLNVLPSIPSESVSFACIDGPYNIKVHNSYSSEKQKWDSKSKKDFIEFTLKWLNEVYRILKPDGSLYTFYGFTEIETWLEIIRQSKFTNHLENAIVLAKSKGRGTKHKLKSIREDLFHLTKHPKKYIWNSESYLRRVIANYHNKGWEKRGWDYGPDGETPMRYTSVGNVLPLFMEPGFENQKKGTVVDIATGEPMAWSGLDVDVQFPTIPSYVNPIEKNFHTNQKPIILLSMLALICSEDGDRILDCFAGSMSMGVASLITGRNFIGIEQAKDTYKVGLQRIKDTDLPRWDNFVKTHIKADNSKKFKFGIL